MSGWIKLHRSILDWEWYSDHNTTRLFMYCLLRANHKDTSYRGMDIKRGEFITSYGKLAMATGLSVRNVRTCLDKLKSTGEVTSKATSKLTRLTVCNYTAYNDTAGDSDKQSVAMPSGNRQATDKLPTTDKKVKKERSKEKEIDALFDEWYKAYPIHKDRKTARRAYGKALDSASPQELLEGIRTSGVLTSEYQKYPATWLNAGCWEDEIITGANGQQEPTSSNGIPLSKIKYLDDGTPYYDAH